MAAPKITQHQSLSLVQEYLECTPLVEELSLDCSSVLCYHWADHAKQINKFKKTMNEETFSGIRLRERLKLMEFQSAKAQEVEVWLTNANGLVKTSLFELYQYYTSERFKDWLLNKGEVMVSLEKESGPFMPVRSLRWLEREEIKPHILQKLLTGNFPLRGFRLRFNWPVQLTEHEDKLSPIGATIKQLTSQGILLEMEENAYQKLAMGNQDRNLLMEIGLGELQKIAKQTPEKMIKTIMTSALDQEWEKMPRLFSLGKIGDEIKRMKKSSRQTVNWFVPFSRLPTSTVETLYSLLLGSRDFLENRS